MERENVTILGPTSKNSRSLRTTVPMGIVKSLHLKEGDRIKWELKAKDSQLIVYIIKSEDNQIEHTNDT